MCENSDKDNILIAVEDKTDLIKYEFLRRYYTQWNKIIHPENRIIVDCHAGTGHVIYNPPRGKSQIKFGSPMLAILKTIILSRNLTIILNEKKKRRFEYLENQINNILEHGILIFEKQIPPERTHRLDNNRTRIERPLQKIRKYPEIVDASPKIGSGFEKTFIKTQANIILKNSDIEDIIDEILETYLRNGTRIKSDGQLQQWKTKALFFVDPCGKMEWFPVINAICKRVGIKNDIKSEKDAGIELLLNWSYTTINRTQESPDRNSILGKIYGISEEEANRQFPMSMEMDDYLERYKEKLQEYFEYVITLGVPLQKKKQIKSPKHRIYFLIHCSNNKRAYVNAKRAFEKAWAAWRKIGDGQKFIDNFF